MVAAAVAIAITVASTAYQYQQAAKAKRKAKDAADARKGFELVVEADMSPLPIAYGRNKIGGVRVYHNVSNDYNNTTSNADQTFSSGLPSQFNSKREFLYFQQALAYNGISSVKDVILNNDMYLDDPRLTQNNSGYRIDVNHNGGVVDKLIRVNCPNRAQAKFTQTAYASCMFKIDRDDPQFQGVPDLAFVVEGRATKQVVNGLLQSNAIYSANPAWALLDYLLNFRKLSVEDIDLASFESSAAVCDVIVLKNAKVGGVFFKPTGGIGQDTRDIPRYECNILLDTSQPFRENVENILNTMGDARLVWSQGQYKLILQYPGVNNANIVLADVITDDDLTLGSSVRVHYPEADQRLNKCLVKFSDESLDFKQSSATWPRYTGNVSGFDVPSTSTFYSPRSGWIQRGAGNLLNSSGVTHSGKFFWVYRPDVSGTFSIEAFATLEGKLEIGPKSAYTIPTNKSDTAFQPASAVLSYNFIVGTVVESGRDHDTTRARQYYEEVSKNFQIQLTAGVEYVILMSAEAYGNQPPSVAARITSPQNSLAWSTREPSFTGYIVRDYSADVAVYEAMLLEDNNVALESETFLDGVTSEYHALAKAEELVRTSRSAAEVELDIILSDRYFEPGDVIRVESESMQLGTDSSFYIKLDKVKPAEDGTCLLSGSRFDWTQLAWNVADDQYLKPSPVFGIEFTAPSFLQYLPDLYDTRESVGSLIWINSGSSAVLEYWLFMHVPGEVNGNGELLFKKLGSAPEAPFNLSGIVYDQVIFGIRAVSRSGALSEMVTTSTVSMDPSIPPVPQAFSAVISGDRNQIVTLGWAIPSLREDLTAYRNHYATEVYRGKINDIALASRLATTVDTGQYTEVPAEFGELFYWIRFVSYAGVFGEFTESESVQYDYYSTLVDTSFEPPPPTNLQANAIIESVVLTWVNPIFSESGGHAATLIFAAPWLTDEPTIADAAVIAVVDSAAIYSHAVPANSRWVYWAKAKSVGGAVSGTYAGPIEAMTDQLARIVLEELEGKILKSSLTTTLAESIDKADGVTKAIEVQAGLIEGLGAQWTIKTDVNGRVAGVGLLNTGDVSLFEILADQFAIFHPSATDSLVFGVADGKTVMSGAYIEDATIDNAKILSLNVDKLVSSSGNFAEILVGNGEITNLMIGNEIYSNNYVEGVAGWKLDKNGNAELVSATFRGTVLEGSDIDYDIITGNKPDSGATRNVFQGVYLAGNSYIKGDIVVYEENSWIADVNTINVPPPLTAESNSTVWGLYALQGERGPQGVPGESAFTWIRYADDSLGSGISNDPSGKTHIGFAYNKAESTESNIPGDYTWSKIEGQDGAPGEKGEDGLTKYTWIAYSDSSNGEALYQQPTNSTLYIGIATNKDTEIESSVSTDYTWSRFRGEDGAEGVQGETGIVLYTWIKYADNASGSGISNQPDGKTYIGFAYNKLSQIESNASGDYIWSRISGLDGTPGVDGEDGAPRYTWVAYSSNANGSPLYQTPNSSTAYIGIAVNKLTATESATPSDYTWSKFKGDDGPQGVPGETGSALYTWIKYADDVSGNGISNSPNGKEYIGFAYNKTTATESSTPSNYIWSKLGGLDGTPGQDGEDGAPRYTWVAYSNNANGAPLYQTPNSSTVYIGIAVNKLTATESATPSDYTWSKFRGDDGPQGVPGETGSTLYTWIKYANDASGNGISNSPNGKEYIGFAYNKTTAAESNTPSNYIWSKLGGEDGLQGPRGLQGPNGTQGVRGTDGADGAPRYTWVAYSNSSNGNPLYQTPNSSTAYIGIAVNKLTASESSNYWDYTWSKFRGDDGSNGSPGRDGTNGSNGAPGRDGTNGSQGAGTATVYRASYSQPSTPGNSSQFPPSYWSTSPPGGSAPVWEMRGQAYTGSSVWQWKTPYISAEFWRKPGTVKIAGGSIVADDIYVGTVNIKGNAVTVPAVSKGVELTGEVNGYQTATTITITLAQPGDVAVLWSFDQYYYGPGSWKYYIDRVTNGITTRVGGRTSWMGAVSDQPGGAYLDEDVPAGSHTYLLRWEGTSWQVHAFGTIVIIGAKR